MRSSTHAAAARRPAMVTYIINLVVMIVLAILGVVAGILQAVL
jgi:hypothetical protein